jgi:hypothetical protein
MRSGSILGGDERYRSQLALLPRFPAPPCCTGLFYRISISFINSLITCVHFYFFYFRLSVKGANASATFTHMPPKQPRALTPCQHLRRCSSHQLCLQLHLICQVRAAGNQCSAHLLVISAQLSIYLPIYHLIFVRTLAHYCRFCW